ncbi:MAG: acyl-CoA dehydrogenase, partial [Nonlabens ulvanivorans]
RTHKNIARTSVEEQKEQIAMSQLYLYSAVKIIQNRAEEGISSFAEGDEQRMMLMGLKRFTKYINLPNIIELRNVVADKVTGENKYPFTKA